jgi:ubiquinone/menaquinone biosynthesis C-methylase UbiE
VLHPELDIQDAWDPDAVRRGWPAGLENEGLLRHVWSKPVALTARGATGRVLEVAAAEALHSCHLAEQGLECIVLEPSAALLARARDHMARLGVRVELVRGIGEALPFPDRTFDRVLCDSALDHFAAPDLGVREMARVLQPGGRLVLSFVNYASLSARLSRLWYRIDRVRAPEEAAALRFWDSPVPHEHTFEGTYRNMLALCGQYLELERVIGTSMLFGVPGWGAFLRRLPERRARGLVLTLDRVSRRLPGLADVLFTVWRHRREEEFQGIGIAMMPRLARLGAGRPAAPPVRVATMRSSPADPVHRARTAGARRVARVGSASSSDLATLPGDRTRGWFDDLARRGPFRHAALLGGSPLAERWLRQDASPRLDVFDPSRAALGVLRHRLGAVLHRARLARADLDFLTLPARRYDVVWSDDGLCDVVNLEYLLDEIAAALRPGGLFAYHGYVAEPPQRFAPARRARVEAALCEIPPRWRPASPNPMAAGLRAPHDPLSAVRADEILALAKARLEPVHEVRGGALFPIPQALDLAGLAREAPEVVARLDELEAAALDDPAVGPTLAYVVLRKNV